MNKWLLSLFAIISGLTGCTTQEREPLQLPNIVFIYADDLGFGDISAYNPSSKIKTPRIDQLAKEGMIFTDAHSPAAICGPSRYGLLTGRYPWRAPGGTRNGHAYGQCKIEPDRATIATMLQARGYNTAQIGKWGLRADYREALKDPKLPLDSIQPDKFDFTKPIHGANTRGFDYSFSMVLLAGREGRQLMKNHQWFFENGYPYQRKKPDPANFDWHSCLPNLTQKAVEYIQAYAGKRGDSAFHINRKAPFFLYFDPHAPHSPILPTAEFVGTSQAGPYGDFVTQLDHSVGQVLDALEQNGLTRNTLIIVSSDNGPERTAYPRIKTHDHYSMGPLRGVKRDLWEGGHRVPLIVSYPASGQKGVVNNQPVGLIDIFATLAALTGSKIPEGAAEDSDNILPTLLNPSNELNERKPLIYHSEDRRFAIRDKEWVLINSRTGMASTEPDWFRELRGVENHDMNIELFNLETDPKQLKNVARDYPEKVRELQAKLERTIGASQ